MRTIQLHDSQLQEVRDFLRAQGLPADDVVLSPHYFIGQFEHSRLVGMAGLEFYGNEALLRSVAVAPSHRRQGLAAALLQELIATARKLQVNRIGLLTETAHDHFLHAGFRDTTRTAFSTAMQQSSEFAAVCPVSAAAMVMEL